MAALLEDLIRGLATPSGIALVAVVGLSCLYIVERLVYRVPLPQGVALVREPEGARRFSLRTRLAYYTNCESLFREAYDTYTKRGKPVVVPGFGVRNEVIMPQSSMQWVLAQPNETLDLGQAFAEIDQGTLVKHEMNRVLENLCKAMNDELGVAFDDNFGTDTENWQEIDLNNTLQQVVAQAANRFTVGLPLCREKEYINTSLKINQLLVLNAGVVSGLPRIFQPIVGALFQFVIGLLVKRIGTFFLPLWRQRKETLAWDRDDPKHEEPLDHTQMMLRYSSSERPEEFQDDDMITRRIVTANFGSMHQTQIQVTNLILNVLGSDAEYRTIATLRDELTRVLGAGETRWTKSLVSQLYRADSVARETFRLQSFAGRSTFRKVMTSDCTTPDGIHLPKGTLLSFLSQPAQADPDLLEDADKFDPFRFSRMREFAANRAEKSPPVSFVSTSPTFLPFGHGKHACPGRFLLDFELKMILAYVLRNYDIAFPERYQGKRPPNIWMAEAMVPPSGVKIMVKRRVKLAC